jgi:hypothetical protein
MFSSAFLKTVLIFGLPRAPLDDLERAVADALGNVAFLPRYMRR